MKYVEEEKNREAGFPWTKDSNDLQDNKYATITKLKSTEKRLLKGENDAHENKIKIGDMISRGVARKVISSELSEYNGVLLRFKEERICFMGDISKMFHSIKISLRDEIINLLL